MESDEINSHNSDSVSSLNPRHTCIFSMFEDAVLTLIFISWMFTLTLTATGDSWEAVRRNNGALN